MEFMTAFITGLIVAFLFMIFVYINRGTMFKKQKPLAKAFMIFVVFATFFTVAAILFMFFPTIEQMLTDLYKGFVPFLYPE